MSLNIKDIKPGDVINLNDYRAGGSIYVMILSRYKNSNDLFICLKRNGIVQQYIKIYEKYDINLCV